MLVTVSSNGASEGPVIRLWDLAARTPGEPPPAIKPAEGIRIASPKLPMPSPVTAFAVHCSGWPNVTMVAGLADGSVHLLRGDAERDKFFRAAIDRPADAVTTGAVTGLHFTGDSTALQLYVVSVKETGIIDLRTSVKTVLYGAGASLRCSTVDSSGSLVLARPKAIYFFSPDGRGPCFVSEGEKRAIYWVRHYLLCVSIDGQHSAAAPSSSSSPAGSSHADVLHAFDLRNKLSAVRVDAGAAITALVPVWGGVTALTADGRVVILRERDLSHKLESLFAKNLFGVALNIAESELADAGTLADIHRRSGDHLYGKHDFSGAVVEYCQTAGALEPSYVIRRYLDAQRIHNLTSYLECLHDKGLATSDHTTLLLNCYTKLKDVTKLDEFLRRGEEGDQPTLNFDVDIAVKVLRGAGYFEHALYVAQAAGQADWYLDILLGDCESYDESLVYLQGLPRAEAGAALKKHGKALVTHRPEATTALLMQLGTPGEHPTDWLARVADFAHIYSERPMALMLLCEFILNSQATPPGEAFLFHTLLELYLADDLPDEDAGASAASGEPSSSRNVRREQATELLKRGWPSGEEPRYDSDAVLVLCRMRHFREGLLFLFEQMRLFREVLQLHLAADNDAAIIETCVRLGDTSEGGDSHLWYEALQYFGSQQTDCAQQVRDILGHLESRKLLAPLVVLQELAKNPALPLGVVRDYVARQLTVEGAAIEQDRAAIAKLTAETMQLRTEANELKTKARIFQSSKCALTGAPLELPAVHFLCGHAFNLRSLGESDRECPLCAPQFKTILDIRRSLQTGTGEQGKFFTQLKHSADGFGVVAEFFGRGLLNNTSVTTAAE